jgi:hypothetical protein
MINRTNLVLPYHESDFFYQTGAKRSKGLNFLKGETYKTPLGNQPE